MSVTVKRPLDQKDDSVNKHFCAERELDDPLESSQTADFTSIEEPFRRVSESDVGITEFVGNLPGFNAVIKERYSDFVVREISTEGKIVKLTNLARPRNPDKDYNVQYSFDEETLQKLEDLESKKIQDVSIDVTDLDKNARKDIHFALKQMYGSLESRTEDRGPQKFVVVKHRQNNKGGRNRFQLSHKGNYLQFVLYKENRDTMDAINNISSFLRVHSSKAFSYAGSKDKRGKTSQLVTAYKVTPEKLLSINNRFDLIRVGNIQFKETPLKLGDLKGNQFEMVLRQVDGEDEVILKSVESLASNGFINYYGLQRFGTSSVPTHTIGKALLCGDWKGAVNLILTPREEDDEELHQAKMIWNETQDAKKALVNLRKKWSMEGKLLSGLSTAKQNDFNAGIFAIPRNMRLMYIHSFQSFIWNKVASKRIKKHGLKVLAGDLVSKQVGVNLDDNETEPDMDDQRKSILSSMVQVISEDDVDKYTISDVLLPLPGHSVTFPENEIKEWYEEFLKEYQMDMSNFNSKVKSFALSGAYRKLIVVPEELESEIVPYDDFLKPLILSDLDILQDKSLPPKLTSGNLKALKLSFKLPPSAYATMAVREILKRTPSTTQLK